MRQIISKLSKLIVPILIAGIAIGSAHAANSINLNRNPVVVNPFQSVVQTIIDRNPVIAAEDIINSDGPTILPMIIGDVFSPDTTPERPCVLVPPHFIGPGGAIGQVVTTWYNNILGEYSNEYIMTAADNNGDGYFENFSDALPNNSFNNFCYKQYQNGNPFIDDDGDGLYHEDGPDGNDNDGDGLIDEDGYNSSQLLFLGNSNGDSALDSQGDNELVLDERKFLAVAKCEDIEEDTISINESYNLNPVRCEDGDGGYQFLPLNQEEAMLDQVEVEPGDVIRLGVYVHNNSLYATEDGLNPAAVADDILIQFDTQTNPNRPRAGVSSPDNIYHEDPYSTSTSDIIPDLGDMDGDGNSTEPARMMTDVTHLISSSAIELEPIPEATWYYNSVVRTSPSNTNHLPWQFDTDDYTTIRNFNDNGDVFLIEFDTSIVEGEHQAGLNQQAGCFEFSGWYFFDYLVIPGESACEELDINIIQQWPEEEAAPIIRDEFITPGDADPPIPASFSDASDEGLYIAADGAPMIVEINRNGYGGELIWELLKYNTSSGDLEPYLETAEHFCSTTDPANLQEDNCDDGDVLSLDDNEIIFNRIIADPSFDTPYNQDTYKIFNLNTFDVVLHIYAPEENQDPNSDTSCTESLFLPTCIDLIITEPDLTEEITLNDLSDGIDITIELIPEYWNGYVTYSTNNECGVFDLDNDGAFTDSTTPDGLGNYTVDYRLSTYETPKTVKYTVDQSLPGCSESVGDGDMISVLAGPGGRAGECAERFTLIGVEPTECIEANITPISDIHIDDGSTEINTELEIIADPGWVGAARIWVCSDPSSVSNCAYSQDPTATINGGPQPFLEVGVQNGDIIPITIDNISDPPQYIFVHTLNTGAAPDICDAVQGIEWCGDGLINDGEDCDDGDLNGTPDSTCSETCEVVEIPILCEELEIIPPTGGIDCDATPTLINLDLVPTEWVGDIEWSSDDLATTFDTNLSCSSAAPTITTTSDGLGDGLSAYICTCTEEAEISVVAVGEEDVCNDDLNTNPGGDEGICLELNLTTIPTPVYLEDMGSEFDATVEVVADSNWLGGVLNILVCSDSSSLSDCQNSLDPGAEITINSAPTGSITMGDGSNNVTVETVIENDIVEASVTNISDPSNTIAAFVTDEDLCEIDAEFEWCGDGIVNNGEECDPNDPAAPPECTSTCELEDPPEEFCTDLNITTIPTPIYLEDAGSEFDALIDISGTTAWTGNTLNLLVCSNPANLASCQGSLDPTAVINVNTSPAGSTTIGDSSNNVTVDPVIDGDQVNVSIIGISDPSSTFAAFVTGEPLCEDITNFEYCGDGIVNDGEECDPNDPAAPPECNTNCELEEPPEGICLELELATDPTPVYLEDGGSEFSATIDITGETLWTEGELNLLVCGNPTTLTNCQSTLDSTAEITIDSSPTGSTVAGEGSNNVTVDPVIDGDQVTATVTNVLDPTNTIAAFVTGEDLCEDNSGFEYCGDGIVNNDEECDPNDPAAPPECTSTCELEEPPEEGICTELELLTEPADIYIADSTSSFDATLNISGESTWEGDPLTLLVCEDPTTLAACQDTKDTSVTITVISAPTDVTLTGDGTSEVTIDPVSSDDSVEVNVSGITNPDYALAAFVLESTVCENSRAFGYCGDGILDESEECDDGILDGTVCSATCETPEEPEEPPTGPPSGGGRCQDLSITSTSNPTSFPVKITISTKPGHWAENNGASFDYTGPGGFQSYDALGDPIIPNLLNTQSKTVLYYGGYGDNVVVEETVDRRACHAEIKFSEPPIIPPTEDPDPPEEGPPGETTDPGGPTDSGSVPGGGHGDGPGGGGSSCPGLDITRPTPKTLVDATGYLKIIAPRATLIESSSDYYNGPFLYNTAGVKNVMFIDLLADDGEAAYAITRDLLGNSTSAGDGSTPGIIDGDAASFANTTLETTSKEIYYYVIDGTGNAVKEMLDPVTIFVADTNYPEYPSCGDNIQNSLAPPLGPELKKFGWVHPTGGKTANDSGYDVNYQITYLNNGDENIEEINIKDTIGMNQKNGRAVIYGKESKDNYIIWSDSNDPKGYWPAPHYGDYADGKVNIDSNPLVEPGIDTWYYGIGVHWIQEQKNNELSTWGGHDIQLPDCTDFIEESDITISAESTASSSTEFSAAPMLSEEPTITAAPIPTQETYLEDGQLCFEGRIDNPDGITIRNMDPDTVIKFEYEGIMETDEFFENCIDRNSTMPMTESFHNTAEATLPNSGTVVDSAVETLYTTCNYVLTRNSGNVLFHDFADPGANLAQLVEDNIRNSDGLVFIRKTLSETVGRIFGGGVHGDLTASRCDDLDNNNLIPHIFSSFICEMFYEEDQVDSGWTPDVIEEQTDFDYLQGYEVSGYHTNLTTLDPESPGLRQFQANASLVDQNQTRGKVYKIEGGHLYLGDRDDESNPTTSAPMALPAGSGAMTIIVDGDLKIFQNISYPEDSGRANHEVTSLAFIVKGDIYVHPEVNQLAGVYIAKKKDDGKGGAFKTISTNSTDKGSSNKQLVIHGSVYGDLEPLINKRTFVGTPSLDGGNIVIRYNNRVMLNTPPGLKDETDLKWERVAR